MTRRSRADRCRSIPFHISSANRGGWWLSRSCRAGPAKQVVGHDERQDRESHHPPRFALDMWNGIERHLSARERRVIPAYFRGQRVRRFVASGGEKKGNVPDKSQRDQFRLDIGHEVTLRFLRASSVDVSAPLCKQRA